MTLFLWPLMSYLSYYANKPRKQATQGNSEPNTACFFILWQCEITLGICDTNIVSGVGCERMCRCSFLNFLMV
jgi:hypothetical protein